MEFSRNIPESVLDEIALEGLDGITLNTLWYRLKTRNNFLLALDDISKNFIWKLVCNDCAIEFFLLKESRPPLVDYNRYNYIDPEVEIICEPDTLPEDIYPIAPVEDKDKGIRGSCSTYQTRQNITHEAKEQSLTDAVSKYGERLVLVACQAARDVALAGVHAEDLETLVINSYIMLERIGRSRQHGESTQGKHGLSRLNIPPKSAFYFRKRLLANGMLVKQPISMRVSNRNVLGTLLHLPRFFSLRLPKVLMLIKRLLQILKDVPNHMLDYNAIRERLCTTVQLKKILATNELRQYIEIEHVPYRALFPQATIKEWKMKNNDSERTIKVVRLIDPFIDPEHLFMGEESPPEDGSVISEEEESSGSGILTNAFLQEHNHSIIRQAYKTVEASGSEGITQGALAEKLGLSQLDARSALRALTRLQLVDCVTKEVRKNRVFVYITTTHFSENSIRAQYEHEQAKVRVFLQNTFNENSNDTSRSGTPDSLAQSSSNIQLEKDVVLREEDVKEEEGLFRPNVSRKILVDEGEAVNSELTHRSLKRVNIILEAIRTHMVIEEVGVLLRLIMAEEAREGVDARIDRRSLRRLLARLACEGQIKQMRIVLRCGERERALNFICQPGVDQTNSVIRSAVDQAKLKLFCIAKNQLNRSSVKPERRVRAENIDIGGGNVEIDPSLTQSVQEAKDNLLHHKQGIKLVHNSSSGRFYGVEPKCIRVKEMHRLFFYLVYSYSGIINGDQAALREEVLLNHPEIDESMLENIPNLYQSKVGWNMFIEPLPTHNGWGEGWSFLCDILLRLPLSTFVKVVNVTYEIHGLEDFLKHPIKRHLLLKHLPMNIRQGLIYARKYIFTVHDVVTNMVYLGLAQFGPSSLKEKDQVFIYLNRRTSILDTTPSAPGYHHISRDIEYDKKEYYFECMEDVEKYWYEVWHVCTNTLLGSINTMAGQSITLEMLRKKPAMVEAVRPRDPEEAPKLDNGEVPGDRLGAAGFDSAFFAHLKRNWTFNKMASMLLNRLEQQVKKTGQEVGVMKQILEPQVPHAAPGRLAGLRSKTSRFTECTNLRGEVLPVPVTTELNNQESRGQKRKRFEKIDSTRKSTTSSLPRKRKTSSSKPISKTRIVKARKKRAPRRPYYDEKDRQALMRMRRLRVMWSTAEDSFLLLCKVASTYVSGSLRTMVPFCVVRDCLHETHAESRNKTSRACQRRVAYMMRNPTTEYQVVNAYQELEQDPEIIAISGGGPITKSDRSVSAEKTEEITVERFRKVLDHLKSRYSQGVSAGSTLKLPPTIEEFHRQYELVQSNSNLRNRRPLLEVHNIVDIYCSVVYNVIHSSMCTSEDKASWGFHLFNIYQQYPDSLVRSTLAKMKNDMMIAQRKRSLLKNKKYFDSPLTAVPYKLSITYIHLFLSRYQYQVFHRSYQHLTGLIRNEKKAITDGVDLLSNDWPGIEIGPHDGGSAALAVTLFSLGVARFHYQIPDQIIIFDPKLKDHPEELDNLVKRYNNWVRDIDKAKESTKDERVVSQRRRLGLTTAAAAGVNTVMPKLITVEDVRPPSRSESQISSTIPNQPGAEESLLRSGYDRHQSQLIIRTASRIGLHMLREDMVNDPQSMTGKPAPNHIQQEHFVINSCKVFVHIESNNPLENGWLLLSPQKRQEVLGSIQTSLPQEILKKPISFLEFYDSPDCTEAVKADAVKIMQTIASKKEMGILYHDLPQAVGELACTTIKLEQHMIILTGCKAVIKVGVLAGRYVASQFISPWVIQSFRLFKRGKEKLAPFDASKVSKHPDLRLQETRTEEEISTTHNNSSESNNPSTDAKCARKKKPDRKAPQVSETEPTAGPSEARTGEESNLEITNSTESRGEASQNDAMLPSNDQECIATRRKRRIIAPTHHNVKRPKTIDTLGDEDRINLLVHVKPWVKIDGNLNRRVLDRLLGAVHSHIMTKPGCTIRQLAERFHPALQAFQTRELIEILDQLGCVQLYSIVRKGKPGPFAPRTTLTKVPYTMFMSNEEVFCDPKVDGILRLGEFIGDKMYEKDYIPRCSCHNYADS